MNSIFVGLVPFSWRLGLVRSKPGVKVVYGFGPFRLAFHKI
jgi:hypothetical protein